MTKDQIIRAKLMRDKSKEAEHVVRFIDGVVLIEKSRQ